MIFNKHSALKDLHAIFGASKSAWLRYDYDKMLAVYQNQYRTALGTELHEYAASQIMLGRKQTTAKQLKDKFETYLFRKYFDDILKELKPYGNVLLKHMAYLPNESFEATKSFINDAIGFRMTPEQPIAFSKLFYGTADAISFRDGVLRVHDLKTGESKVDMEQLEIYVAFFCLEYDIKPSDIRIELRIYQLENIIVHNPTVEDIIPIIDKAITFNKIFNEVNSEED